VWDFLSTDSKSITTFFCFSSGGEKFIMRSFIICALTQYCAGDKMEKNDMGVAFRADGREERRV
jgi:hypothetical protein